VPTDIEQTREAVKDARRVAVITGAGVSAESGVPTFRGKEGLWRNYDPMQLATPEAFAQDPRLVWEWYNWRRELIAKCSPNPAHDAIARLEEQKAPGFLLITQNVDGLHALAGSRRMVEVHGSIWRVRCTGQCPYGGEDRTVPLDPLPPRCERCGELLRPGVVWFGEMLPMEPLNMIEAFFAEGDPDVVIISGTSALFPYIQSWAVRARQTGGILVEVNAERTPISGVADVVLLGKAGEVLPKIITNCE